MTFRGDSRFPLNLFHAARKFRERGKKPAIGAKNGALDIGPEVGTRRKSPLSRSSTAARQDQDTFRERISK